MYFENSADDAPEGKALLMCLSIDAKLDLALASPKSIGLWGLICRSGSEPFRMLGGRA
jgi:hypothetical protein